MNKKATKKVSKKKEAVQYSDTIKDNTQSTEQQARNAEQLTIADLQDIAKVIDIATRRGAFGAGEMTEVGVIFDKLNKFIVLVSQQQQQQQQQADAA